MTTIQEALTTAVRLHQAGRLQEADQVYRQILGVDPTNADAWHLRGVLASQVAQHDVAMQSIGKAIAIRPDFAEAHNNLGLVLAAKGLFAEAAAAHERAVRIRPDYAEAYNNLGNALASQCNYAGAIDAYRNAAKLKPQYAEAHYNLGVALQAIKADDEAADCYRKAIDLKRDYAEAYNNLGAILLDRNQPAGAARCLETAVKLKPQYADAHLNLGNVLAKQSRLAEAIQCYRRAVEIAPKMLAARVSLGNVLKNSGRLDEAIDNYHQALATNPDFAEAHVNLGNALKEQGKLGEAVESYRRAVAIQPGRAEAHTNLGLVLQDQGKLEEAEACHRRAAVHKPNDPDVQINLGNVLQDQGRLGEAERCFHRALELNADHAMAHCAQAHLMLLTGDMEHGWNEFEWRWKAGRLTVRDFDRPAWAGGSLEGKAILLHAEQGMGDTLQFIRYATVVKGLGGSVVVECQKVLSKILSRCPGIDLLVPRGDKLPAFDFHAPMLSLPALLKTTIDTIPSRVPYVFADDRLVGLWREKLGGVEGFRIGVNWRGRPGLGAHQWRDIPMEHFAGLAELDGVRLISLQKQEFKVQNSTFKVEEAAIGRSDPSLTRRVSEGAVGGGEPVIVDFGEELDAEHGAFMDTAAIMMNLDLVITSDTSVAHLAGALGVPVWVALPFVPDWRWMLERSDSPWYPTMRLFRQKTRGDWAGVFREIEEALREGGRMKDEG